MSFLSNVVKFFKSSSTTSSLVKTALLGFALNKLSRSAIKDNQSGTENIDSGVRLQISPNAESKIPILYGSAYFGGNISDAAMTNANKTMWYCLVLSEKIGVKYSDSTQASYTFEDVYWNDQRIVFEADGVTVSYTVDRNSNIDRSLSGLVKIYLYAGNSQTQQAPDGYTITSNNAYDLFPNWTNNITHPMENLIFALVRVDYNREKNVTGLGNLLFHISNDMFLPGDVFYDYMKASYGAGINPNNIITTDVTNLNLYSAQSVAYDDEGTGAQTLGDRYQINGLIDTSNKVLQNIESILSCAASWLSYDSHEGKWGIVINKSESSIASFDDSNILGSISVSGTGLQDLYNSVNVQFPHRDLRDSGDFVKIEIPLVDRNANEEDNTLNITYDIINEPIQAQILGLIELKQSRVDKIIKFDIDYGVYNLKAGDVIDVSNDTYNFNSKLFRIISINEIQDSNNGLMMEITALEYDNNVYSTADLFRYTRSDSNGIITIGSIGTPGTPTVTKYEIATRPRIEITTTSPTGVVEGIEYWLTTDVTEPNDTLRSYTLIGTKRPIGGGVYTSGTNVTLEYSALETSNFFIKTRGFNTTTVGPYSSPSGLVEFEPTQVTNAIDQNTIASDGLGGILTTLALLDLLKGVDDLYKGLGGAGSLFDKIFDVFEDITGVDLPGAFGGANPAYSLSSNPRVITPGSSTVIKLSTVNVADNTTVPYTITGVTSADIDGASLTGNFTVSSNSASFTLNTIPEIADNTEIVLTLDDDTNVKITIVISSASGVTNVPATDDLSQCSLGPFYYGQLIFNKSSIDTQIPGTTLPVTGGQCGDTGSSFVVPTTGASFFPRLTLDPELTGSTYKLKITPSRGAIYIPVSTQDSTYYYVPSSYNGIRCASSLIADMITGSNTDYSRIIKLNETGLGNVVMSVNNLTAANVTSIYGASWPNHSAPAQLIVRSASNFGSFVLYNITSSSSGTLTVSHVAGNITSFTVDQQVTIDIQSYSNDIPYYIGRQGFDLEINASQKSVIDEILQNTRISWADDPDTFVFSGSGGTDLWEQGTPNTSDVTITFEIFVDSVSEGTYSTVISEYVAPDNNPNGY